MLVALCFTAFVFVQGAVSPSATTTPTPTLTSSPESVSVSESPLSFSTTPTNSPSPASLSITPTLSVSPYASLPGRWCERDACTAGSCIIGARCCSGFCVRDELVPRTITIGQSCNYAGIASACALCQSGLMCSPANLCVVAGVGYGCSCSSDADCVTGYCGPSSKCSFRSMGVGAVCGSTAICASGLSCASGYCQAQSRGATCAGANQPYDPATVPTYHLVSTLDGGCASADYCSGQVCTAKKLSGTSCVTHVECLTGLCNVGYCALLESVQEQQECSVDVACAYNLFCGGGVCQKKVGQGARCTQSAVLPYTTNYTSSTWCQSGLICSLFDGQRPVCMVGSLGPGQGCYNSDQCSSVSSFGCVQTAPGTLGYCSSHSAGAVCSAGNATGCGTNTCGCTNTDGTAAGSWRCDLPAATDTCASLRTAAVDEVYANGYYQVPRGDLASISLAQMPANLAYLCCQACASRNNMTSGLLTTYAAYLGRSIDCTTTPPRLGAAWTTGNQTNLCGGARAAGPVIVAAMSFATVFTGCSGTRVSTPVSSTSSHGKTDASYIVGPVVGCVVALFAIVAVVVVCKRVRAARQAQSQPNAQGPPRNRRWKDPQDDESGSGRRRRRSGRKAPPTPETSEESDGGASKNRGVHMGNYAPGSAEPSAASEASCDGSDPPDYEAATTPARRTRVEVPDRPDPKKPGVKTVTRWLNNVANGPARR